MRFHIIVVFALLSVAMGQDGIYKIDEQVKKDPMFQSYPSSLLPGVKNALILAQIIKKLFFINGFDVFNKEGQMVGILPNYYIGFPKTGTTYAYNWLQERLPCALEKNQHGSFRKELNVIRHMLSNVNCSLDPDKSLFVTSCDEESVEFSLLESLEPFFSGVYDLKSSSFCQQVDFIDGVPTLMYDSKMPLYDEKGQKIVIVFDSLVFIKAITPQARFIALTRKNNIQSLHSHYFYFKGKDVEQKDYEQDLISTVERLEYFQDVKQKCHQLLVSKLERPHIASYPSSCTLQRVMVLFGEHSLFVTDADSMEMCTDNILNWLGQKNIVLTNQTCLNQVHENPHNWDMGFPRTSIIARLENRAVQLIENVVYPPIEKEYFFD